MRPRFRILGPLEVEGVSALGGPKQRALLARLVLHTGRVVPVERLVDDLWPEGPPETARHALQVYVSTLRRALGSDRLRGERGGYVLDAEADDVDAVRFERLAGDGARLLERSDVAKARELLAEALGLWRGPALPDVGQSLEAERARLDAARLAALEDRIEADLALGRHDDLIAELEQLVREEPLRERARRQLMLALYRSGRQGDALAAYRNARRALVEQLGLEPSTELRQLEAAILRQEPSLDVEPAEVRARRRLPAPATPLIGRRREIEELSALLRDGVRLLTLTGPGGTGKTRLAIQTAHELAATFDDGAVFVGLAALRDPELVPGEIAAALELEVAGDPQRALTDHLRDRRELLVLDNFEQVDEAAPVLRPLLEGAPGLKLLVTSRHTLRLYGEHEYAVPPLALDEEAVPLFVERARATGLPFRASEDVRELCARLDCLPLAIELVAARVRELAPAEMLLTIPRRLALAAEGPRDVPARQQTLRATIAWSHDLLDERERALFASLAVFAGGFSGDAAERVCAARPDELASLAGKSLLTERDGRFAMLETIREYASELLAASDAAPELHRRHAAFYLGLAEEAEPRLRGEQAGAALAELEREHDNLRAAIAWAYEEDSAIGLRLAASLARFWWLRGHLGEGRSHLERALTAGRSEAPSLRATAYRGAAALAMGQGELADARALSEQAVELSRNSADSLALARSLSGLGNIAVAQGDHDAAHAAFDESIPLARASGDERVLATVLSNAGNLALNEGDGERAAGLVRESLDLAERLGQREGVAIGLLNLGLVSVLRGEWDDAVEPLRASLLAAGELRYGEVAGYGLIAAAAVLLHRGDAEQGARVLGAGDRLLKSAEASLEPAERALRERTLATLTARLAPTELEAARAAGAHLELDEAVAAAVEGLARVPPDRHRGREAGQEEGR